MDKRKLDLKGSPSRDEFKYQHKRKLPSNFYATDLDLALVETDEGIVAFLDYKNPRDLLTFTETLAYNQLIEIAPVYIIVSEDLEHGPFEVIYYDEMPPKDYTMEDLRREFLVIRLEDWGEFKEWEEYIRGRIAKKKELTKNNVSMGSNATPIGRLSIEYCSICHEPLALIEVAKDSGQSHKSHMVTKKLAEKAGLPAYVVFYKVNEKGEIIQFRVRQVAPTEGEEQIMTPEQYADFLRKLHRKHSCLIASFL